MVNTICYFDITIGAAPAGRITFELYDDLLPKVCLAAQPMSTPLRETAELIEADNRQLQAAVYRRQDQCSGRQAGLCWERLPPLHQGVSESICEGAADEG